jgi:creatinine amidohydrolase/Fe(II)-dependent formamide hydrolase-like protein
MDCVREHDIPYSIFEDYLFHRKTDEPEGYVGNLGFPSAASAEKGKILVERMMAKMMADYHRLGFD